MFLPSKKHCDVCGKKVELPKKKSAVAEDEWAGWYGSDLLNGMYLLCSKCGRKWYYKYYLPSGINDKYEGDEFVKQWYLLFEKFLKENGVVRLMFT